MNIIIETLSDGKITLSIESDSTVLDLKKNLANHINTPIDKANKIELFYLDKILINDKTLKENGIVTNSTISQVAVVELQHVELDRNVAVHNTELVMAGIRPFGYKIIGESLGLF